MMNNNVAKKDRPMLFSGAMVRAILDGSKTQTRRTIKPQPPEGEPIRAGHYHPSLTDRRGEQQPGAEVFGAYTQDGEWALPCPHGQPGERIWVKENYRLLDSLDCDSATRVAERCLDAGYSTPWAPIHYEADGVQRDWKHVGTPAHDGLPRAGKLRPSIFLPRWACRIELEIFSVRVERLNDCSEADARAEGVTIEDRYLNGYCAGEFLPPSIRAYRDLWESLNGAGSWDVNPWIWVVEFKQVTP